MHCDAVKNDDSGMHHKRMVSPKILPGAGLRANYSISFADTNISPAPVGTTKPLPLPIQIFATKKSGRASRRQAEKFPNEVEWASRRVSPPRPNDVSVDDLNSFVPCYKQKKGHSRHDDV